MHELFTVVPPGEAFAALRRGCSPLVRSETIPLSSADGRVLAADVISVDTLPSFARATMDGYAVRALDTHGAAESSPAYLRCVGEALMGVPPAVHVGANEAVRIHTGAMLPLGADAVVMVEETNLHGDEVEVLTSAAVGENVVAVGEDIGAGAVAVAAGKRLRAADLGGLAAVGAASVRVIVRPRIALLSTGDEIVPVGSVPRMAQVRDVNASTIAATIDRAGGLARAGGIVRDDAAALFNAAREALADADALVITAGSSVSARDVTAEVVDRLGSPGVLAHGIALRPGKPTIVAVCDGKPVIGLPGNPASALIVAWRLVRPLVRYLGGEDVSGDGLDDATTRDAMLTLNVPSRPGREDYVACSLVRDPDGALHATPIFGTSNLIFTLVRSDGVIAVPLDRSGLGAGERVTVIVP